MHLTPSSVVSASRSPGSAPCRAATCAHARRRAVLTRRESLLAEEARLPGVRHTEGVYPGDGFRRSTVRRLAEQMESVAQGVAQRVIDLVVEALDMNALIARIDLNIVLARVDLNEVVERIDLNEVVDRIDLNEVVDRLDMNKLLAQVDINQVVSRIDVESLVKNTDLGALMASSTNTLATEAVDLGRSHAVRMDDSIARWVSRIRRNNKGRAEPPELPNTPEEP
jgi:hypothetical protein